MICFEDYLVYKLGLYKFFMFLICLVFFLLTFAECEFDLEGDSKNFL